MDNDLLFSLDLFFSKLFFFSNSTHYIEVLFKLLWFLLYIYVYIIYIHSLLFFLFWFILIYRFYSVFPQSFFSLADRFHSPIFAFNYSLSFTLEINPELVLEVEERIRKGGVAQAASDPYQSLSPSPPTVVRGITTGIPFTSHDPQHRSLSAPLAYSVRGFSPLQSEDADALCAGITAGRPVARSCKSAKPVKGLASSQSAELPGLAPAPAPSGSVAKKCGARSHGGGFHPYPCPTTSLSPSLLTPSFTSANSERLNLYHQSMTTSFAQQCIIGPPSGAVPHHGPFRSLSVGQQRRSGLETVVETCSPSDTLSDDDMDTDLVGN